MAIAPRNVELRSEHFHGSYCLATFSRNAAQNVSTRRRRSLPVFCASGFSFGTVKKSLDEVEEGDSKNNGVFSFGTRFGTVKSTEKLTTTKKDLSLSLPLGRLRRADSKTVFVAGATGQIGARISQQLLRSGFTVRGGVRELDVAQQLAEFATQYGVLSRDEARRLNAVECEFKDPEGIAKAIGNAANVVVTVGATEDGPRGKVTPKDALQVVEAASLANVGHIVVVTETAGASISDNPFAGITDFFGKLFGGGNGAQVTLESLLDSLVDTELKFTFLKTSSTDVDDFSPSGSVLLLSEGTYNQGTGKVSKSQLASVVAGVFENITVAENKVVEVTSMASESPRPILELLSAIPEDGRRAALKEAREKAEADEREKQIREKAEAEAKQALEDAQEAAELASQLEQEAKKLATQEARATASAEKAMAKAQQAADKFKEFGLAFSFKKEEPSSSEEEEKDAGIASFLSKTFSSRTLSDAETQSPLEDEVKKAGFGKLFSGSPKGSEPPPKKTRRALKQRQSRQPVAAVAEEKPTQKAEPVKLFGGLFKQDTVYVDE